MLIHKDTQLFNTSWGWLCMHAVHHWGQCMQQQQIAVEHRQQLHCLRAMRVDSDSTSQHRGGGSDMAGCHQQLLASSTQASML
jgi:hypothetical protein